MSSKDSYFANIFNLAQELQQKEILTDVFLQPREISYKDPLLGEKNETFLNLKKLGYPAHQLLLAAASPFFKYLFEEHYADHRDSTITVMIPEASARALQCLLLFVYTSKLNVPSNLYEEVFQLSQSLKITSLSIALDAKQSHLHGKEKEHCHLSPKKGMRRKGTSFRSKGKVHKTSSNLTTQGNILGERMIKLLYKSDIHEASYSSGFEYGKDNPTKVDEGINRRNNFHCAYNDGIKKIEKRKIFEGISDSHSANSIRTSVAYTNNNLLHDSGVNILINNAQGNTINTLNPKQEHKAGKLFLISTSHDLVNKNTSNLVLNLCPSLDRTIIPQVTTTSQANKVSSYLYSGHIPTSNSVSSSFTPSSNDKNSDQSFTGPQNSFYPLLQGEMPSGSFGASELGPSDEEEEKLLKLQVLLKDCEDVDLRGTNIYEAQSTPTRDQSMEEKFLQSSPEHISTDDWIISDALEDSMKEDKAPNDTEALAASLLPPSKPLYDKSDTGDSPKKNNNIKMNLKCQFCDKSFFEMKELQNHLRVIHQKIGIVCHICGRFFTKKSDLRLHESRHRKPTLPCSTCGKLFKLNKDLIAHRETHERQPTFECTNCGKLLTSRRNLQLHIGGVHKQLKPYKCGQCQKKYTKKVDLLKHIRKIHTGEKPYACDKCDECFHIAASLYYHRDLHLTGAKFSCKSCSKSFKTRIALISHKRTHTARQKSVKCQGILCKEDSIEDIGIKSINCRFCRGSFTTAELFEKHMQSYHGAHVKVSKIKVKQVAIPGAFSKSRKNVEKTFFPNNGEDSTTVQSITVIPLQSNNGSSTWDSGESKDSIDLKVISASAINLSPLKSVRATYDKKKPLPCLESETGVPQGNKRTSNFSCPVNFSPMTSACHNSIAIDKNPPISFGNRSLSRNDRDSKSLVLVKSNREFVVQSPLLADDHTVESFTMQRNDPYSQLCNDSTLRSEKLESFVDNLNSKSTNVEKLFDISSFDLVDSFKT